jgi:hypothetical protein
MEVGGRDLFGRMSDIGYSKTRHSLQCDSDSGRRSARRIWHQESILIIEHDETLYNQELATS